MSPRLHRVAFALLATTLALRPHPTGAGEPAATARPAEAAVKAPTPDRWAPFRRLVGAWEGTNRGQPGAGTVRREYRFALRERFIEVRNTSTYPPQEKNAKGEVHEDVGFLSLDRTRQAYVLRQFHVEGFVNTYVVPVAQAGQGSIVLTSEAIENLPPGWRARETYRFTGSDELVEVFEVAEPGKDFTIYSESWLKRVR
jgi:hypothetical protein